MIEQLLELDTELFLYLNKLGSSTWDGLWLVITDKFTFVPLIAAMVTFTDQITNAFKHGFMRPRPCRLDSLIDEGMRYIAERCGRYGFFSGHASNSMGAAVFGGLVLRPYFKNLIIILLFYYLIIGLI